MTDEQLLTAWRTRKVDLANLIDSLRRTEAERVRLTNEIAEARKAEETAWAALLDLRNGVTK